MDSTQYTAPSTCRNAPRSRVTPLNRCCRVYSSLCSPFCSDHAVWQWIRHDISPSTCYTSSLVLEVSRCLVVTLPDFKSSWSFVRVYSSPCSPYRPVLFRSRQSSLTGSLKACRFIVVTLPDFVGHHISLPNSTATSRPFERLLRIVVLQSREPSLNSELIMT